MSNLHPLMAEALVALQRGDESAAAEALNALLLEAFRRAYWLAHDFGPAAAPAVIAAYEHIAGVLRAGGNAEQTELADVFLRNLSDAETEGET